MGGVSFKGWDCGVKFRIRKMILKMDFRMDLNVELSFDMDVSLKNGDYLFIKLWIKIYGAKLTVIFAYRVLFFTIDPSVLLIDYYECFLWMQN